MKHINIVFLYIENGEELWLMLIIHIKAKEMIR